MSQFADYIKETRNVDIVESEHGFATYMFLDKQCYIEDIFIAPAYRQKGIASKLADQVKAVAKEKGCTHLVGTVNATFKDPTTSLKALLGYGFKIDQVIQNVIVMKMEI